MKKDSVPGFIKGIAEKTAAAAKEVKKQYEESELARTVSEKTGQARQILDEAGVTEKLTVASNKAGDVFDTLSGQKQLELVEQRLALQLEYNDILASKLEEALERIARLEQRLVMNSTRESA